MVRGERIKYLRTIQQISQTDLALAVGTNQARISKYENGESDANGDTVAALARSLNTTTDYLLGLTDDPSLHIESDGLNEIERAAIAARRRGDFAEAARLILSH